MVLFTITICAHRAESLCLKRCLLHTAIWNANTCQKDILLKVDNSLILPKNDKKCVSVALVGLPNVGKSTLVNQLARRTICPTSSKVHTTMHKAEATYIEDNIQIVFMDTPGLVTNHEMKKYNLAGTFKQDPANSISKADVVGIIQDVTNVYTRHKINDFMLNYLQNKRKDTPLLLIFNKVDKIKKKHPLLQITKQLTENENYPKFDDIFMISALNGDGVDDLRNYLLDSAKVKEWKYEMECFTDQPVEKLIQETIRARLMDILPKQMPYMIKLQLEHIEYNDDRGIDSTVILNCPAQSYVRTLLKHKGNKIKVLAFHVEKELRNAFRRPVFVRLVVQCEKNPTQ